MAELWFVVGFAFGLVVVGFCTIGSFDRGVDSVRLHPWKVELVARKRASIAARARRPAMTPAVTALAGVPIPAVFERRSMNSVPAAERRTSIRRTPDEVLAHISL